MPIDDNWDSTYSPDNIDNPPQRRTCATVAVNQMLMETNPGFRTLLSALEDATGADDVRRGGPDAFRLDEVVTIPVVVHVVYNTGAQNISQAQIDSQIDALNRDYGATNTDIANIPQPWAQMPADSKIRFRLATRDPDGKPHNGVTRTQTGISGFTADDSVKFASRGGADGWPASRYLNIWVCNLLQILGYAQFPGGPPATDGVVIGHRFFGQLGTAVDKFNLGRTATHEVGHWLNLHHIWGDKPDCSGSDLVADTPNQQGPNYGAPVYPKISCSNAPNGDMFMNYMDYVDDPVMVMFTPGQVSRMQAALQQMRSGLIAVAATPAKPRRKSK
jgi:hypothetical protein